MYEIGDLVTVKFKIIRTDSKYCLLEAVDIQDPTVMFNQSYPIHVSISKTDLLNHTIRCKNCKSFI